MNNVIIIVPTLNEKENIEILINQLVTTNIVFDLLFIDDNSNDGTQEVIKNLLKKNQNINCIFRPKKEGVGSAHKDGLIWSYRKNYKIKQEKINELLLKETKIGLHSRKIYKVFFKKILNEKNKLKKLIKKIRNKKLTIHGYGASTKGNVILQFYDIGNKDVNYIADRNPLKYNLFTPGTKIKIISENYSRRLRPDYFLVLPWHFKKEILIREKKIRQKGVKFIFPLPKLQVV